MPCLASPALTENAAKAAIKIEIQNFLRLKNRSSVKLFTQLKSKYRSSSKLDFESRLVLLQGPMNFSRSEVLHPILSLIKSAPAIAIESSACHPQSTKPTLLKESCHAPFFSNRAVWNIRFRWSFKIKGAFPVAFKKAMRAVAYNDYWWDVYHRIVVVVILRFSQLVSVWLVFNWQLTHW